jgi:hypothetical protein
MARASALSSYGACMQRRPRTLTDEDIGTTWTRVPLATFRPGPDQADPDQADLTDGTDRMDLSLADHLDPWFPPGTFRKAL